MRGSAENPFLAFAKRPHLDGLFTRSEVQLANRNPGLPLEALRYDVTPLGLHYQLSHFDIPGIDPAAWRLEVSGACARPLHLSLGELRDLPTTTRRVTMECAGNGRGDMAPRYQSMPWLGGAVSTADWTGVSLSSVLELVGPLPEAREVAFLGSDRGFDAGVEHEFGRSLPLETALDATVMLAIAMNGAPLAPQHGAPLRLIVPGWYGMASVKWLRHIELRDRPFEGLQQVASYRYRTRDGDPGVPITTMRVRALMIPPGMPDWYTRRRFVAAGPQMLSGRAWSGGGTPIARVEIGVDGQWLDAELDPQPEPFAWCAWRFRWDAQAGEHELACRATDRSGAIQPLESPWNVSGMGNNAVQRIAVTVR
jgi:DMSO/TMAO reductase YedYZ molybdopterin-dependent catalytic subunit